MEHHPIFRDPAFSGGYRGPFFPDRWFDFIGAIQSAWKRPWLSPQPEGMQRGIGIPGFDEEYFEWCALLQSVRNADDRYVMVELGAGYGRWGVRGAIAARRLGIPHIRVKLVEAEPQHAEWAREYIALNGVADLVTVTEAAIAYSSQAVPFAINHNVRGLDAATWYGQAIVDWDAQTAASTGEIYFGRDVYRNPNSFGHILVESLPLEAVLADLDRIDLIDADIQGAEGDMIANSIDTLCAKVARIYLGTHSVTIEDRIREVFNRAEWINEWDFSLQGERDTPYGKISFGDGVQSWINPAL